MKKPSVATDFVLPHEAEEKQAEHRVCAAKDCAREGIYPAPKSPARLRPYLWFCLEHVRAYNRQWNYFANMDAHAINSYTDHATVWERPSWPFGVRGRRGHRPDQTSMHDPFDLADDIFRHKRPSRESAKAKHRRPQSEARLLADEVRQALCELDMPATLDWQDHWLAIKRQYKALAKKHHPDTNGKSACQEKLKAINHALAVLNKHRRQAA